MPTRTLSRLSELVTFLEDECDDDFALFRGQREDKPLVPKLGRVRPRPKTISEAEARMLRAFKLQAVAYLTDLPKDEWEWLAVAQHHGMATRFLDWTLNPLAALWFAVSQPPAKDDKGAQIDGSLWMFCPDDDLRVPDSFSAEGPTSISGFRVYEPPHLNPRIRAQSGIFTAHPYDPTRDNFRPLESEASFAESLSKFLIPAQAFSDLRYQLDRCGVNAATVYPDIGGVAVHAEWLHRLDEDEEAVDDAEAPAPAAPQADA